MSTQTMSAKKSTFLKDRSMEWKSDFWDFYLTNQSFLDRILQAQVYHFRNCSALFDSGDIMQEVLYRLNDNNVMAQYDPAKSKLNTFITNKINFYVRHVVAEEQEKKHKQPHAEFNVDKNSHDAPTSYSNLNPRIQGEDEILFKERIVQMKKKLGKKQWLIFCKLFEGYKMSEIANELGVSVPMISYNEVSKIKAQMKGVYTF